MFAGFCKDSRDGGLKGINFKVEHSTTIGDTFATQWVATADFPAEPYRGSDAYITKDGLMQAMVTTFDGGALKIEEWLACSHSRWPHRPRASATAATDPSFAPAAQA